MTMSVYDVLEAWQAGRTTDERAFQLTGATSRRELYVFCLWSDVAILDTLSDDERKAIEADRKVMNEPVDSA